VGLFLAGIAAVGVGAGGAVAAGDRPPAEAGRTLKGGPSNYRTLLKALRPGDRLVLAPGTYREGLPIHGIVGEPGRQVTIEGAAGPSPAVFLGRRGANTVSIVNAAHVTVRNLRLDGLGLGVDAVKCEGHADWAHHISLEGLVIVNHGDHQQTVGISTKCPAWGWLVRGNTILGAGTGMYFGSSDGTAPFFASVIERNLVVNPRGYALQIKHQTSRPILDGMPSEPSRTIIRRNRFVKGDGASTGELARPSVLVGHFPVAGPGANDYYVVYGNVFYDNPTEALLQGEGNIALYSNLFVNQRGDAVHIQPHNHVPRSIFVFHNTVLASGAGISVTGGEPGYRRHVGRNAVFAAEPIRGEADGMNLVATFAQAQRDLVSPFAGPDQSDFAPRSGVLKSNAPLPDNVRDFPDWDKDLQGLVRLGSVVGACQPRTAGAGRAPCR
jgi:hypothetical protein